jgi:hypothetical protein
MTDKVVEKKRKRDSDAKLVDIVAIETADEKKETGPKPRTIDDEMLLTAVDFALRAEVQPLLQTFNKGNTFETYQNMLDLPTSAFLVKLASRSEELLANITAEGFRCVRKRFQDSVDRGVGTWHAAIYALESITLQEVILVQLDRIANGFGMTYKNGEEKDVLAELEGMKSCFLAKRSDWYKDDCTGMDGKPIRFFSQSEFVDYKSVL